MIKLLRTIRLDPSDGFVFDRAAEPGEWAVTGSGLFRQVDVSAMSPKLRAAFRSGFLAIESLGFSTLVEVAEASEAEHVALVERLSEQLLQHFGAPDAQTAREVAAEELAFAASLCDHTPGTVVAMRRTYEAGSIKEQFRILQRREATPGADRMHALARVFDFIEVEDGPGDRVDLVGLTETRR